MMNTKQARLNQNPILKNLLLTNSKQGRYIAESLFTTLPQGLRGMTLGVVGNENQRRHDLRRAPGTPTRRIDISFKGKVYTVDQHSVEIPIPREFFEEQETAKKLNVTANLDMSGTAMHTAADVLRLGYEIEAAELASNPATYSGNVLALTGGTKWSADTSKAVLDIATAKEMVRKKIGVRPNKLHLSADAYSALTNNKEVISRLGANFSGAVSMTDLKRVLDIPIIEVGDAVWIDGSDNRTDVWGNNAILSYSPVVTGKTVSLAEPAFGNTSTLEGHPLAEEPYYEKQSKSWIFGATYERKANLGVPGAGFLFQNCK